MLYVNAVKLLDLCIKNDIVNTHEGQVLVFREGSDSMEAGWWAEDFEVVALELMGSPEGEHILTEALIKRGICFEPINV